MYKRLYILAIVAFIAFYLIYIFFTNSIDTKYAVGFSRVFSTYDINEINDYLTDETIIICNDKYEKYSELRKNVVLACRERKYQIDDSYGHGNNGFNENVQEITVYLFGKLDNENIGEATVLMRLKRIGFFKFEIASLECDEPIFEYIFYGNA